MKRIITLVLLIATYIVSAQEKEPLWVLNGVALTDNMVREVFSKAINPNDIDHVDVIKNKKAAEQYGKKAKNGAILITLKEREEYVHQPLMVVNDVVLTNLAVRQLFMDSLNPDKIEAITVLKDETATAEYGVAGANGVVLFTLKKNGK